MSQETSDWYSGNNTLFHSGSLWWPCCCQWQHLRQHHWDTCRDIHIFSHKHTHTAMYCILSLSVSPPSFILLWHANYTQLSAAAKGVRFMAKSNTSSVEGCSVCVIANAPLSALCRVTGVCLQVCVFVCPCTYYISTKICILASPRDLFGGGDLVLVWVIIRFRLLLR